MTRKHITPKTGGPKAQKYASTKLPLLESAKINKPTPALTSYSTEVVRPLQPHVTSEESSSLIDLDYRIIDATLVFNMFEVHNYFYEKFVKKIENDIPILSQICLSVWSQSLISLKT